MYPYHNKIKQRIRNGELVAYDYISDYKNDGERLLLYFKSYPFIRPIRPHRYADYTEILAQWNKKQALASAEKKQN